MASCKERQAKRRAKLRNSSEAYQAYLEKDRLRKAAERLAKRKAMSSVEIEEDRLKLLREEENAS